MKDDTGHLTQLVIKVRQEVQRPGSTDLPRFLAASDLHGNHWRLEEILQTAKSEGFAKLFLVGDIYFGSGGWAMYRLLRSLIDTPESPEIVPMWGNHELAFVAGMLGNDSQLRFFFGFGGRELIQEMNADPATSQQPRIRAGQRESPGSEDLAEIRASELLREMASWIQQTHRLFVTDLYGTGYLHACPRITRGGRLELQYQTQTGLAALETMQRDLAEAKASNEPIFSALLQTDISPLWGLFEISSAKQFDQAYQPLGIRQLVFGHRHRTHAINIAQVNRQIGIAVDFEQGLGGYLVIGPEGLVFRSFVDQASHQIEETTLTVPTGQRSPRETHLLDVEESLVRRIIDAEIALFGELSPSSSQNRREFTKLEKLRQQGFTWIHRLYAELYPLVKDLTVRKEMFSLVVESCDEEAFKSLIHLLHHKTRELEACGGDWYNEAYVEAKSLVEVLLAALREMPVTRLGLLDVSLRGTTSRVNLLELYQKVMQLQDPDLAVMAVDNLGALNYWAADQELRRAFFHDARKVRVHAARALAARGEVTYPLVKSLIQSPDNWVRFLAVWTLGKLGEADSDIGRQAVQDVRQLLERESDWLIYTSGKELLRKLGDPEAHELPDRSEIPNLTDEIIGTLQAIVDSQKEPFRKAFKVYYISVVISSLIYRRGLVGLDLDELKVYVNKSDYFPPHYRFYKSATRDDAGQWQGWRRLWIRGETFNRPDGPQIVELSPVEAAQSPPGGPQTFVLYDHRQGDQVVLPDLEQVLDEFGAGKAKDRIRDSLLRNWQSLSGAQQQLINRLHAAATVKMLFDLPAEVFLVKDDLTMLEELSQADFEPLAPLPKSLLSLDPPAARLLATDVPQSKTLISAHWLDAIKYPIQAWIDLQADGRVAPAARASKS